MNEDKFQGRAPKYYDLFVGLFVAILLVSEVASTKLIKISFIQSAGAIILFPVAYIFSDIFTEVYGYARARRAIWIGFAALVLQALVLVAVQYLPASPSWPNQEAYKQILGFVPRITAASIIAYWIGGFANDFVLAKMKVLTSGRFLWMRTIGSTLAGQLVDSFLFIGLIYAGRLPYPLIAQIAFTQYLLKVVYESLATPLTYYVINVIKRKEGLDVYDYKTNFTPFKFKVEEPAAS